MRVSVCECARVCVRGMICMRVYVCVRLYARVCPWHALHVRACVCVWGGRCGEEEQTHRVMLKIQA